ncbi:MAG: DUF1127 domain-containing protein [Acetobacteraceae bacterium]|nr:DUF1127 domain-containing protein [Acetobacteraceae bacterium]
MLLATFFASAFAPALPVLGPMRIARDVAARLGAAAGDAFNRLHRVIAERRAAVELAAMDDRMLRDIGLSRYEVRHAARYGYPGRAKPAAASVLPGPVGGATSAALALVLALLALDACASAPQHLAIRGTSACEAVGLRSQGGRAPHGTPRCMVATGAPRLPMVVG